MDVLGLFQGFVCQQYLQSYPASGLVLLDSYPPSPGEEQETISLGRVGPRIYCACIAPAVDGDFFVVSFRGVRIVVFVRSDHENHY